MNRPFSDQEFGQLFLLLFYSHQSASFHFFYTKTQQIISNIEGLDLKMYCWQTFRSVLSWTVSDREKRFDRFPEAEAGFHNSVKIAIALFSTIVGSYPHSYIQNWLSTNSTINGTGRGLSCPDLVLFKKSSNNERCNFKIPSKILTNQNLVEKQIVNRYGRPCMIDKHFISVYRYYLLFLQQFLKK